MSSVPQVTLESLGPGDCSVDDTARRRFEAARKAGRPDPIDSFLPPPEDPRYLATLELLVHLELGFAWQGWKRPQGDDDATVVRPPTVEAFLERFPVLNQPAIVQRLAQREYWARQRHGDQPPFSEYHSRFPDFEDGLTEIDIPFPTPVAAISDYPDIPGYEIFGLLGRGGMGIVYWAWQKALRRTVALKMLQGGDPAPAIVARFQAESEAVARLQHPNIVQIFDLGSLHGRPYFTMEYVDGGSLAQKLAGKPQPPRPSAQLIQTLARAMHHAHQCGIVHRDLKPANILMKDEGGRMKEDADASFVLDPSAFLPKITDFGLAKFLVGGGSDQTQTGAILGTPSYMAPEQAGGQRGAISPAVDVYALGAILYELLTGRPPFRAETTLDTIQQVLKEDPVPPTRLQSKVPRDLETICLKCLEKDPQRRYAHALALAEDLERFLAGDSILARPLGPLGRGLKWARRRPVRAAVLGVSVLAASLMLAMGWFYNLEVQDQRDQAIAARHLAEERELMARRYLYQANLKLAQQAWDDSHVGLMLELLETQRPQPGQSDLRGFEWYYLQGLCHQDRLTIRGSTHPLFTVAFSPDGQTLALGGGTEEEPGEIQLWDVTTGKARGQCRGHTRAVRRLVFSPDGKTLASAGEDSTIRLWDAASGNGLATLTGHRAPVRGLAFSPDGKTLATSGMDRTVKLWNLQGGQETRTFPMKEDRILALAFAPDGRTLAGAGTENTVKLWAAGTGQELAVMKGHTDPVHALAFNTAGDLLATGSSDRTVRLWKVPSGQEVSILRGHTGSVGSVTFAPNGKTLASGGHDGAVKLWDLAQARARATFKGHLGWVWSVAFSPDGQTLASASQDKTVKLWDPFALEEPATLEGHTDEVTGAAFSPDNRLLATASRDGTSKIWDAATGREIRMLTGHEGWVMAVAFAPDGRSLASAGIDSLVRRWDVATWNEHKPLSGHRSPIRCLAFSPDGTLLATGSGYYEGSGGDASGNRVRLWELEGNRLHVPIRGHGHSIRSLAFSPDGRMLATAGWDRTIKLWDVASGEEVRVLNGHSSPVLAVAFAPDGQTLATGHMDRNIVLWRVADGKVRAVLEGHTGPVNSVAFSPDGKILASGSDDFRVKLWDPVTRRERLSLKGHSGQVRWVTFSPDGWTLASASQDKTVKLWHLKLGQEMVP